MADGKMAMAGAAGLLISLMFIAVAMSLQNAGAYPASEQPGLALYYQSFSITGLISGLVVILGFVSGRR